MGRYEVVRELKSGGMGSVTLAKTPEGELVVLKRPHAHDDEARTRLRDEARLGTRLLHPGIVDTLDLFEDDDGPVLVVAYIEGLTLENLRREGPMPTGFVARVGRQIAEALEALHSATDEHGVPLHILHRDVSPGNIIIDEFGDAKLIDLGIAAFDERHAENTRDGYLRGTIRYLGPELVEGLPHVPRTDLWALGLVLYEAALGGFAYPGKTDHEVVAQIVSGHPLDRAGGEFVAPEIRAALRPLLEPALKKRIPTAGEAAALFMDVESLFDNARSITADTIRHILDRRSKRKAPALSAKGEVTEHLDLSERSVQPSHHEMAKQVGLSTEVLELEPWSQDAKPFDPFASQSSLPQVSDEVVETSAEDIASFADEETFALPPDRPAEISTIQAALQKAHSDESSAESSSEGSSWGDETSAEEASPYDSFDRMEIDDIALHLADEESSDDEQTELTVQEVIAGLNSLELEESRPRKPSPPPTPRPQAFEPAVGDKANVFGRLKLKRVVSQEVAAIPPEPFDGDLNEHLPELELPELQSLDELDGLSALEHKERVAGFDALLETEALSNDTVVLPKDLLLAEDFVGLTPESLASMEPDAAVAPAHDTMLLERSLLQQVRVSTLPGQQNFISDTLNAPLPAMSLPVQELTLLSDTPDVDASLPELENKNVDDEKPSLLVTLDPALLTPIERKAENPFAREVAPPKTPTDIVVTPKVEEILQPPRCHAETLNAKPKAQPEISAEESTEAKDLERHQSKVVAQPLPKAPEPKKPPVKLVPVEAPKKQAARLFEVPAEEVQSSTLSLDDVLNFMK